METGLSLIVRADGIGDEQAPLVKFEATRDKRPSPQVPVTVMSCFGRLRTVLVDTNANGLRPGASTDPEAGPNFR